MEKLEEWIETDCNCRFGNLASITVFKIHFCCFVTSLDIVE